jgi:DNA-binding NarL/FixJ family response regulator
VLKVQEPGKLNILIADDHEIVRQGLRALTSSRPNWTVGGEAISGREAIAMAVQHKPNPHILIMDIDMSQLSVQEATQHLRKLLPNTEILILSVHYSNQRVWRLLFETGADAYLSKADVSRDIVNAIEAIPDHRSFSTAGAGQIVLDELFNGGYDGTPPPLLRSEITRSGPNLFGLQLRPSKSFP